MARISITKKEHETHLIETPKKQHKIVKQQVTKHTAKAQVSTGKGKSQWKTRLADWTICMLCCVLVAFGNGGRHTSPAAANYPNTHAKYFPD